MLMKNILQSYYNSLTHLIFPHHCEGCGTDVLDDEQLLCINCLVQLPETGYLSIAGNPVEKMFYGRMRVAYAGSLLYFTKESLVQHLIHQLKYKGNREVGLFLGKLLGSQLQQSGRFDEIDAIIPLPLNSKKEFKRGYNQASVICEGIAAVWNKPILKDAVARTVFTETQTHQGRVHRWQNIEGVFEVVNEIALAGKHLLLVDDIVTTGATLEACGSIILAATKNRLSIATVACTL